MTKKVSIKKNLEKIVINVGLGRLRQQSNFEEKSLPEIIKELALITGQKPAPRQAKKSIAGFKTRAGDIIGLQVTLRGKRMEDFFTRVISFVLPRVRDFRGLDLKNVDTGGNLNIGFREQFVFPEISADKSKVNFGLQVTAVSVFESRDEAIDFYRSIGVPLKKSNKENT
ncbi:MAG: 50S ribosomal protein L5 [Patescibacteria group bacterium]|nr:50S ribosomal protein L5 [Patescibacteria group bacterium]